MPLPTGLFCSKKKCLGGETEAIRFYGMKTCFLEDAEKDFQKLAACCKEKGIELIVVMTPVPEETETRFAEEYEKVYTYFEELTGELFIPFWNFNEASYGFERSISGYVTVKATCMVRPRRPSQPDVRVPCRQ